MKALHDTADENYERDKFLEEVNAAYAVLRNDPQAWTEVHAERALWDGTLGDGFQ
jgi:hypothetical protein